MLIGLGMSSIAFAEQVPASGLWQGISPSWKISGAIGSHPVSRPEKDSSPAADGVAWMLRADEVNREGRSLARTDESLKSMAVARVAREVGALERSLAPLRSAENKVAGYQAHVETLKALLDSINVRDPVQRLSLRQASLTGVYLQSLAGQISAESWQKMPVGRPQLVMRPDGGVTDSAALNLRLKWGEFQTAWHGQSALTRPDWITPDRQWAWDLLTDSAKWAAPPEGAYVWVVRDVFRLRIDATFVDSQDQFLGAAFIEVPVVYGEDKAEPSSVWAEFVREDWRQGARLPVGGKDEDFLDRLSGFAGTAKTDGFTSALLGPVSERPFFAVWFQFQKPG